ncbi:MAG: glycoside hydrolase family 9 protein [Gemmatimonadaceae bacterium]|nr:glycoside hydrolase family 9 protein [Gemmatimonadaceae bacterium]
MNGAFLFLSLVAADSNSFIRTNQVGYLPDAPKIAVICSLDSASFSSFEVRDARNRRVLGPAPARATGSFAACRSTFRLDFTALRREGTYTLIAGGIESRPVRIGRDVYAGAADTLLYYMRQQRSGWNPLFQTWVHNQDALIVDHPTRTGQYQDVQGGWADAADFLQYVATSAHATFMLLMAYRDNPRAFADKFDAWGRPGANGIADVLDEARHGLNWLAKMFPAEDSTDELIVFNQIADDRDHSYWDLPPTDTSDYGWGKGSWRPVYPCTGKPQGLFTGKNRSDGLASTAGKYASAFALGASLLREHDVTFAERLRKKAILAYDAGQRFPGVCQTAPGRSPYFYEEDNWVDDMELAAAELFALIGHPRYLSDALRFAEHEPVTPWMGADTARHYQWFPWHNNGHYEIARALDPKHGGIPLEVTAGGEFSPGVVGTVDAEYYRRGLQAVVNRANNGFRVGIPFIWCSNNLMASFATQALLYRQMTGDETFREYEVAALDWLLGVNPWGTSMIIGFPNGGVWAQKPHSQVADLLGVQTQLGGLLDGPVYRSIYENLRGIRLLEPDEYARFNTGFIVYHDDLGDYSTNEPIMDGTANLSYLFAAMAAATVPNR